MIVGSDAVQVEADLVSGSMPCPACAGVLGGWGFARWRVLRSEAGPVALRPRRARCRSCRSTQVLLPDAVLARRVDTVAVIGAALTVASGGLGHRKVADVVGRPASTVRGWIRRFRMVAARVAAHFTGWAARLDPMLGSVVPTGSLLGDAVEAIGMAARAATLRLGSRPPWSWASVLTVGRLLSNTNTPWLAA